MLSPEQWLQLKELAAKYPHMKLDFVWDEPNERLLLYVDGSKEPEITANKQVICWKPPSNRFQFSFVERIGKIIYPSWAKYDFYKQHAGEFDLRLTSGAFRIFRDFYFTYHEGTNTETIAILRHDGEIDIKTWSNGDGYSYYLFARAALEALVKKGNEYHE